MTQVEIPTIRGTGPYKLSFSEGSIIVFVGANGSGKTRLAAFLDERIEMTGRPSHRISAHRALVLPHDLQGISEELARHQFTYGSTGRVSDANWQTKNAIRWGNEPATWLSNDFDKALQLLFAVENRVANQFLSDARSGNIHEPPDSPLKRLREVWRELLPHRDLQTESARINVTGPLGGSPYPGRELSDGERGIIYLLAQTLLARDGGVIVIDEPELHIHKAILSRLFDKIEAARTDCAFIYVTHDVDFAASRQGAQKIFIKEFVPSSTSWDLEPIPDTVDLPESVVTTVLGSRKRVLFVEGETNSLDVAVYRKIYDSHTVIPVGGCAQVIHAVTTFRQHAHLSHIAPVGLIDRDDRSGEEVQNLNSFGIHVLQVAEVENLFLLPGPFKALAALLLHDAEQIVQNFEDLKTLIFSLASQDLDRIVLADAKVKIQRRLDIAITDARTTQNLLNEAATIVRGCDFDTVEREVRSAVEATINNRRYENLLAIYKNKGILGSAAARILGLRNQKEVEDFIDRALKEPTCIFYQAVKSVLPEIGV